MLNIPPALLTQFETCLRNRSVPKPQHGAYTKWLRYYLDFCRKNNFSHAQRESLSNFLNKLQEKKQTIHPPADSQSPSPRSFYFETAQGKNCLLIGASGSGALFRLFTDRDSIFSQQVLH